MDARPQSLRELQEWLAARIAGSEDSTGRRSAAAAVVLALPPGVDPAERLGVYAGGYPARILDSLRESFPAVAHVVGPAAFSALAVRYVAACPPRSYNLNEAGAQLPVFLEGDELSRQLEFLPGLAMLEWAVVRAFHACDLPPFDLSALAGWTDDDWTAAVIAFQPSVQIVRSRWPILAVWEARDTPVEEIDLDLTSGPQAVRVRRAGFDVRCESIAEGEAAAIESLAQGGCLGEVITELAARGADADAVGEWFGRWVQLGMIAHLAGRCPSPDWRRP